MKHKILECLDCSKLARSSEALISSIYPNAHFIEDKGTDTQGFMVLRGYDLIISFRGTQQLRDWLTDFNAFHMVFPYGNLDTKIMVHRGFMIAYLTVRQKIHDLIKSYGKAIGKITCTGHSLGGALAMLCAVDMQYNFRYPVQCYCSGNPMVGNKYFAESYNRRVPNTIRTYMRKDPVPYLPPEWFERESYEGYSQAGKGVKIGPRNPFFGLIMLFRKRFKSDKILDDIFNHDIDLYKQEVNKLK